MDGHAHGSHLSRPLDSPDSTTPTERTMGHAGAAALPSQQNPAHPRPSGDRDSRGADIQTGTGGSREGFADSAPPRRRPPWMGMAMHALPALGSPWRPLFPSLRTPAPRSFSLQQCEETRRACHAPQRRLARPLPCHTPHAPTSPHLWLHPHPTHFAGRLSLPQPSCLEQHQSRSIVRRRFAPCVR